MYELRQWFLSHFKKNSWASLNYSIGSNTVIGLQFHLSRYSGIIFAHIHGHAGHLTGFINLPIGSLVFNTYNTPTGNQTFQHLRTMVCIHPGKETQTAACFRFEGKREIGDFHIQRSNLITFLFLILPFDLRLN
ncbi:hypothetical protein QTP88_014826 [Uroleucon formosanum]